MPKDDPAVPLGGSPGGSWLPIESAPENMVRPVVVFWLNEDGEEMADFDYTEDGCWQKWHDYAEHVEIIGGHGVSYTPPYTHWMPLPPPPSPLAPGPNEMNSLPSQSEQPTTRSQP